MSINLSYSRRCLLNPNNLPSLGEMPVEPAQPHPNMQDLGCNGNTMKRQKTRKVIETYQGLDNCIPSNCQPPKHHRSACTSAVTETRNCTTSRILKEKHKKIIHPCHVFTTVSISFSMLFWIYLTSDIL